MKIIEKCKYFTKTEIILWSVSVFLILGSYLFFGGNGILTLFASAIGVTSLIFCAKGNPMGQFLMIIFSLMYGIISYSFSYYGEMITYLGMTAPMAVFSLVSWIKNPYEKNKSEVKVNKLQNKEVLFMLFLSALVTFIFYFILEYFNTTNMLFSTLSITTSFIAVYLTFRRSPFFALVYALNDIVLIILWIFASFENSEYISVVVCFLVFLANDLYGFISWTRMKKRQEMKI